MEINQKAVDKQYKKYDGRVMFPSSHDIVDDPEVLKSCMIVLEKLLQAGNEVLVTTKPDLEVVTKILNQFGEYKNQIQFRFTISSNNDDDQLRKNVNQDNLKNIHERLKDNPKIRFKDSHLNKMG